MHNHDSLKGLLRESLGETILTDIFLRQCTNPGKRIERKIMYFCVEELPVSIPTSRRDSRGRPIVKNRFIDVAFFVGAGKSAAYHGDVFSIGIEVKSNPDDLIGDQKIQHYIGKTDFFYLAVEDWLIVEALKKAQGLPGIGVISLSSGHIVKPAIRQDVTASIRQQLLLRVLFHHNARQIHFTIPKEIIYDTFQVVPSSSEDDQKGSSTKSSICQTNKTKCTMNFVGNRTRETRPTRLELKSGKFSLWKGSDQAPELFDYAEGQLTGIEIRKRETRNGEMVYCDFHMINGEDRFDISTLASSCVTADIVSRLKNVQDPVHSMLRIDAWLNNKFTNVVMKENGHPVVHATLPRVQRIDRGFKVELDSSSRDAAVMKIIEELNEKLLHKN